MKECIFCEIVDKKIPAKVVYENNRILAFLDINPISKGHTLVIPKQHSSDIFDISEEDLKELIVTTKKIAEAMKKSLRADGINIIHASKEAAQQSVFHFHLHLVPRYKDDGMNAWPKSDYKEKDFEKVGEDIKNAVKKL